MNKRVGMFLVILSLLISVGTLLDISSDFNAALIGVFLIGLPLYILGQMIRVGRDQFRKSGILYIWGFIYCLVIVPALFLSLDGYEELKRETFANQHFILYESYSEASGADLTIGFIILILLIFTFPFMDLPKRGKWIAGSLSILIVIGFISYQYIMWSDYRGIHAEQGLLSHSWKGETETISYDDIREITVLPTVKYASISDPTDDTYFYWKMTFLTVDNQETTYTFHLSEEDINISTRIQQVANEHHIPFVIYQMNKKTKEEFTFQLNLNELNKEPFYSFFGEE
ncbi:hypothetical protein NCCP2222_00850 [Sporosarcina sp. NCCP-2222]|uniref:hypothetical protein n=1 Tax=Sporosarcina sp. NCCP-2222 TaxID=2935073 RepID=UPI00207E4011|nr:hypothetical protein [Sporosarcina sp. NCCP-2222]GKV54138.1 hypothetical protein NCCP2222_00850 [Sporosarcina sp. NCCP-2222]